MKVSKLFIQSSEKYCFYPEFEILPVYPTNILAATANIPPPQGPGIFPLIEAF